MTALKYISIDILAVLLIIAGSDVLHSYVIEPMLSYILIALICFLVGVFFTSGLYHGLSISGLLCVFFLSILYMIGRPVATPLSGVMSKEILSSLLPTIPIGLISGFSGSQVKKMSKRVS